MARTTAPLLSMQAHGDIAGLMQYTRTKGNNVVRAKPNMPAVTSPELVAARLHHTHSVAFYKSKLATVEARDAWQRYATYKRYRMSAYDTAMKAMLESFNQVADPAQTIFITQHLLYGVQFKTKGVATQDDPDEGGFFTCFYGPSPDKLAYGGTVEMYEAQAVQFDLPSHDWPIWVQLFKDSTPRSGILQLSIASYPYPLLEMWCDGTYQTDYDFVAAGWYNGFPYYYSPSMVLTVWSDAHPPTANYIATNEPFVWTEAWYIPIDPSSALGDWSYLGGEQVDFTLKLP